MKIKVKQDWWKNAFKKWYKDILVPIFPEETKKEIDFVVKETAPNKKSTFLDFACGYGRHALELSRRGFEVCGVDFSGELIKIAKKQSSRKNIIFKKGDIRSINLKKKFDAVLLLGNSFGYSNDKENRKIIKNAIRHLKDGGVLILEISNGSQVVKKIKKPWFREQKIEVGDKVFLINENFSFNKLTGTKKSLWKITENNRKSYFIKSLVKFYKPAEIKNLLRSNDLKIKKIFGGFAGVKFKQSDRKMIFIAKKPPSNR